MRALVEMTGKRIGRLAVVGLVPRNEWRTSQADWKCKCVCGTITVASGSSLRTGQVRSCGCLLQSESQLTNASHGEAGRNTSPEWLTWMGMKKRCGQKSHDRARYYDRGISVCTRWAFSYENFLADMGRKPSPAHSIDRINNDLGYEPGNCHWATSREQARNKRNTIAIDIGGVSMLLTDWVDQLGIPGTSLTRLVKETKDSEENVSAHEIKILHGLTSRSWRKGHPRGWRRPSVATLLAAMRGQVETPPDITALIEAQRSGKRMSTPEPFKTPVVESVNAVQFDVPKHAVDCQCRLCRTARRSQP